MNESLVALAPPALPPQAPPIQLTPQDRTSNRGKQALFSIALSLAVIAAVIHEMGGLEIARMRAMMPVSIGFWLVFAAGYLVTPASEWLIFNRLWGIPPGGILALLRKKIYNELLLGYLGEAYFYTWARKRVSLTAAPFGAVKDVAILSAMTGNVVTMLLVAIMLPIVGMTRLGLDSRMLVYSLALLVVISAATMLLRRKVFTLPRSELVMITQVHLARIAFTTLSNAVMWHIVLPQVPLSWWLFLATLRLLVSRLPLMPNKDLLFAGFAVLALGNQGDIGPLMMLMAGLILATHLVLGALLAIRDLAAPEEIAV
ncbi:hypothetical protein EDF56_101846 [Novosphingobium sp. PhB165]|uniref:hypothetical protein n=1 Tax=Novosphingobium sp. PhB165 TaxID=2485105 RepID=UPI0010EBC86D|nr:hypothetical protein [Novosphingobium sp. PhB165]TCM22164.1 hypothetical protein EDF56_101846 [Novosphingobium sp. PhB165]